MIPDGKIDNDFANSNLIKANFVAAHGTLIASIVNLVEECARRERAKATF